MTTAPTEPQFEAAGAFLDAIAAQEFSRLAALLDPDVRLSALLPRGHGVWEGAPAVCAQFDTWFGQATEYELVDASIGRVGASLELRWRLRLTAARLGEQPMVVEQHVYAITDPEGHIVSMRLLCSGFQPEHLDA
jgi:hypothetical protein